MYVRNWSTDLKNLSKYPDKLHKFTLENLINFGTDGQKIDYKILRKELPTLQIDLKKRKFLSMLLTQ